MIESLQLDSVFFLFQMSFPGLPIFILTIKELYFWQLTMLHIQDQSIFNLMCNLSKTTFIRNTFCRFIYHLNIKSRMSSQSPYPFLLLINLDKNLWLFLPHT